jgi:uncharacterized protein YgiM (DUF1202 family)
MLASRLRRPVKAQRLALRTAVFVLIFSLIVPPVFVPVSLAQEPGAPTPDNARLITGNWESLPADQEHWYQFDYPGDNLPIRVWMDVVAAGNAGFQIWTGDQVIQLENGEDVEPLVMGITDEADPGRVFWEGGFSQPGSYLIRISPTTTEESQYLLNIGEIAPDPTAPEEPAEPVIEPEAPAEPFTEPEEPAEPVIEPEEPAEPFTEPEHAIEPLTEPEESAELFTELAESVEPVEPLIELDESVLNVAPIAMTASNLNVQIRTGPSPNYTVERIVPPGTEMIILGQDITDTWLFIHLLDGTPGWVERSLAGFGGQVPVVETPRLTPQTAAQPEIDNSTLSAAPTTPLAEAQQLIIDPNDAIIAPTVSTNVNIRSGPSMEHPIIDSVPPNTPITVLGQDANTLWLSVRLADGSEGWVARDLTTYIGTAPQMETPPIAPLS